MERGLMFVLIRHDESSVVYRDDATGTEITGEKFGDNVMFPPGTPMEFLMGLISDETANGEV